MPDTARVQDKILCPRCGAHILNSARFQWGAVPGLVYEIGDAVSWLQGNDGHFFPSFRLKSIAKSRWRWNCGDPKCHNVVAFDADVYTRNHELSCQDCGAEIFAIAVFVKNGLIDSTRALFDTEVSRLLGAARDRADIVVIRDDGSFWPRDDWYDHTVEFVPDE